MALEIISFAFVNNLITAVCALGMKSDGICFCTAASVHEKDSEHDPKCAEVRKALRDFDINVGSKE